MKETTIEKIRENLKYALILADLFLTGWTRHCLGSECVAVKIFGSDLEQLRTIGQQVNDVTKTVEGIVDLQLEPPANRTDPNQVRPSCCFSIWSSDNFEIIETAPMGE